NQICKLQFSESVRFVFKFFFSSRRRHTISYGDWSSDVCSSDLRAIAAGALYLLEHGGCRRDAESRSAVFLRDQDCEPTGFGQSRSEERRVGKECRSRGSSGNSKSEGRNAIYQRF